MASIMNRISWSLGYKKYEDYQVFVAAVTEDCQAIFEDSHNWNPDEIISSANKIIVFFEAMWKDEDDELTVTIHASDKNGISMGRALFEINNQGYWMFENVDAHFFEGLTYMEDEDGVPYYSLDIGS